MKMLTEKNRKYSTKKKLQSDLWTKNHYKKNLSFSLTLSWRRSLSNRNQSIDLLCKSMGWFLCDRDLRHERIDIAKDIVFNTDQ